MSGMEQRSSTKDAAAKDVPMGSSKEESVLNMGQRSSVKDAALKVAQMELSKGVYVLGMGQSANDAVVKDVPMGSSEEECAGGTGQRSVRDNALLKGVQIKLRMEECVSGMEQRENYAAVKDAQI